MPSTKIVLVHRRNFQERPPVISVMSYLIELGREIHLVTTGINDYYRELLKNKGVKVSCIPFSIDKKSFMMNMIKGALWGVKARKVIKSIEKEGPIVLWVEGNYTFMSLTAGFINRYRHILQHQELFDPMIFKGRLLVSTLRKIMPTAVVNLAPEYNRAHIYRAMLQLKKPVWVLPNKPSFIPSKESLNGLKEKYAEIVKTIGGRKVILYQGVLSGERNLESFIQAVGKLPREEYVLVLLGKRSNRIDYFKTLNPNLIHIEYIPAPDYLLITSLAHIGIVTYLPAELDLIYCAPNKLFEYGAFGIPMLGNEIPGLKYTIEYNGFGAICDDSSTDSVLDAIKFIEANYDTMSSQALHYFNSVDNKTIVEKALAELDK